MSSSVNVLTSPDGLSPVIGEAPFCTPVRHAAVSSVLSKSLHGYASITVNTSLGTSPVKPTREDAAKAEDE